MIKKIYIYSIFTRYIELSLSLRPGMGGGGGGGYSDWVWLGMCGLGVLTQTHCQGSFWQKWTVKNESSGIHASLLGKVVLFSAIICLNIDTIKDEGINANVQTIYS